MLSEIFFLKLEAAVRRSAAEEALIPNARFVPLAPSSAPAIAGAVMPSTAPQQ